MVEDGTDPYLIDKAVYDFGYPMGPFQMGDLAGLDIGWFNRKRKLKEGSYTGRYASDFMDKLAELGHFGQKSGAGFYTYEEGKRGGTPNPLVGEILNDIRKQKNITPKALDAKAVMRRYIAAMINEGAKIVDEKIALRPLDVDMTLIYGYGFPRWRGGPLKYADILGLDNVLADIREFASENPEFWQPSKLLVELVENNKNFDSLNK